MVCVFAAEGEGWFVFLPRKVREVRVVSQNGLQVAARTRIEWHAPEPST
jgi:hypothetical protein